jgi:hypothetical protein
MPANDSFEKRGGLFMRLRTEGEAHEIRVGHQLAHLIDIFFVERTQDQTRCLKNGHWLPKHEQSASFDL